LENKFNPGRVGGKRQRKEQEPVGLPGKPPGSPIFFDLVGNRIGNRLKVGSTKDRVGYIADKDSQKDITEDRRKNITQDLEDCLKGERKRGTASLFRGPSPWIEISRKTGRMISIHPDPRWLSPPSP
jgi:hypothetical protein